jgi:hypothetical protein
MRQGNFFDTKIAIATLGRNLYINIKRAAFGWNFDLKLGGLH